MAKKERWGKTGAAGLADGKYIFQYVEFAPRDSKGRPDFIYPDPTQYDDSPLPRVGFRLLILDGPVRVGENFVASQRWKGVVPEEGDVTFQAKGSQPPGFIRWITAFGMRFPTEDDPGDTALVDPPDPENAKEILMALEVILKKRKEDGCLAQGNVGDFELPNGQVIKGRIIWDSMTSVAEKMAKMFLEREVVPKDKKGELRQEAQDLMRTLHAAGAWSVAEGREHCEKEYGSKFTKDLAIGQLQDLLTYMQEIAEEKGVELVSEF